MLAPLDYVVIVAYLAAITVFGSWFGRFQHTTRDYFLSDRSVPWWAVCCTVVATETSALVMLVRQGTVTGAFVGESLAYIIPPVGEAQLLTPGGRRAPGIGTGFASPRGFGPVKLDGKLITRRAARFEPDDMPATITARRESAAGASSTLW